MYLTKYDVDLEWNKLDQDSVTCIHFTYKWEFVEISLSAEQEIKDTKLVEGEGKSRLRWWQNCRF
jgi:hypothetical protein